MEPWVAEAAAHIGHRAERELEALVAISSPSGDVAGAEECTAVCAALLPGAATAERIPCSSPGHAPDLLARMPGSGTGRVLLLGHVDTVIAHDEHRPLEREGDKLIGSGTVDMKGGVVLALSVMQAFARRPSDYAELALLLVCDEEWRTSPFAHVERFRGWDACLCFEAGDATGDGVEGVIVRRKAAGTVRVRAYGRAAHSGSSPDQGINALLALAEAAQAVAAQHDPAGPDRLTAVPTILRSGDAFNVVPEAGELLCDVRADREAAILRLVEGLPDEAGGARLAPELVRLWPGMDAEEATRDVLRRAGGLAGLELAGMSRGGASDASHFAPAIPVTIDGLGPRGGQAHHPGEFVRVGSLHRRAEIALAVTSAALGAQAGTERE
jgi:glutamate carboxypeptidase